MNTKRFARTMVIASILLMNVGCDQISKIAVRKSVNYHESIELISSYLVLTKVENSGAFLSLGDSLPYSVRTLLLLILPVLVLVYGLIFLISETKISRPTLVGACFVIGGGIGNIYDRIMYGSVTDFLHIDFVIFRTGIFNMADLSIMTGMAIILVHSFVNKGLILEDQAQSH